MRALTLSLAILGLGCGTVTFRPVVKSVGEFKDLSGVAEKSDDVSPESARQVKVLIDQFPEGISIDHDVLRVDPTRYETLGRVEAHLNNPLSTNLGLWVYDYLPSEEWRYGYCAWQVPLSWVTLTLWAWLVPLHYPCKISMGSDEERTGHIVESLQRSARALGADLVVVPAIGGTTVISGTKNSAVVSQVNATGAWGYALRTKR